MNNFLRIGIIEIEDFNREIELNEHRFFKDSKRQKEVLALKNTQSIFLRGPIVGSIPTFIRRSLKINVGNAEWDFWTLHSLHFPIFKEFLKNFANKNNAKLSRALITRLAPRRQVHPHIDTGKYYLNRDRYHLVLKSEGSLLLSGRESVIMKSGEIWKFNNKELHSAYNFSDDYRTHLIFDLKPLSN